MKKYFLKDKTGEVVNFIIAPDEESAVEYFSTIKGIPEKDLIKIYNIEKE